MLMGVLNLRLGSKRPQINSAISVGNNTLIISALYATQLTTSQANGRSESIETP